MHFGAIIDTTDGHLSRVSFESDTREATQIVILVPRDGHQYAKSPKKSTSVETSISRISQR